MTDATLALASYLLTILVLVLTILALARWNAADQRRDQHQPETFTATEPGWYHFTSTLPLDGKRTTVTEVTYIADDIAKEDTVEQHDDQPTLREQSIPMPSRYSSRDLVPYGLHLAHSGCLMARRDAATDHICDECGGMFGATVGAL